MSTKKLILLLPLYVDQYILDDNNAGVTSGVFVNRGIWIETVEINVNVTMEIEAI